ncbi:MAG: hypothetical protein ACRD0B_04435 [Acidimicrobiales bacterium]
MALVLVGLSALCWSSCASYSGSSAADKVHSWLATSNFVVNHDTLLSDIAAARRAAARGTALQLRTVCAGMQFDIGTAYDTLPTPQESLTEALDDADQALFKAGADCARAGSTHSAAVRRALSRMRAAEEALDRAAVLLRKDGFDWHMRP